MSDRSDILVLVADESSATLYASNDGMTRRLREIERVSPMHEPADDDGATARHVFACELMMALGRCVREQGCNGVIIFAVASMMEELRQAQTGTIAQKLIAQIVGNPSKPGHFLSVSMAALPLLRAAGIRCAAGCADEQTIHLGKPLDALPANCAA